MLKQVSGVVNLLERMPAAFGRLCVETRKNGICRQRIKNQPPSGGCVLKLYKSAEIHTKVKPAAFGRLCVETNNGSGQSAGGGAQPPSGGCVLKQNSVKTNSLQFASRLRAAVC